MVALTLNPTETDTQSARSVPLVRGQDSLLFKKSKSELAVGSHNLTAVATKGQYEVGIKITQEG